MNYYPARRKNHCCGCQGDIICLPHKHPPLLQTLVRYLRQGDIFSIHGLFCYVLFNSTFFTALIKAGDGNIEGDI